MITVDWKPIDDVKSELVKGGRYWVAYYDIDGDFCSDVACWSGECWEDDPDGVLDYTHVADFERPDPPKTD